MGKSEKLFPLSTVGGRIQNKRREIGLNRYELYDLLFPNNNTIDNSKGKTVYNWESGNTELDYDTMFRICKILNCSSDYLLGLDECTDKTTQFIHECTGLSEASINIISQHHCYLLDEFIQSDAYNELDNNELFWLENSYYNFKYYANAIIDIQNKYDSKDLSSEMECTIGNIQEDYIKKIEHNGLQIDLFAYKCSTAFNNFLNSAKKDLAVKYEYEKYSNIMKKLS